MQDKKNGETRCEADKNGETRRETKKNKEMRPAVRLRIQTANPVAVDARIFPDCESAYSVKMLTVVCIQTRKISRAFASLLF